MARQPRGPRTAKERRNISTGVKNFWREHGGTVMKVGAGAGVLAAGTVALRKRGVKGAKQALNGAAKTIGIGGPSAPLQLKSGQPKIAGLLPPAGGTRGGRAIVHVPSSNLVNNASKTVGSVGGSFLGQASKTARQTSKAFNQGLNTTPTKGTASYNVGRVAARLDVSGKKALKKGANKAGKALNKLFGN